MGIDRDDFVDLSKWSNNGGFGISGGWAYHPGDGQGNGYITRAMAAGDTYIETKLYFDNGNDWAMLKMQGAATNLYNRVGAAILISPAGSLHDFLQNSTDATITAGIRAPRSVATAIRVGLHCRASALAYDFYLEGVLVGTRTVSAIPTGTLFQLGAYNGAWGRFDYFISSDRLLTPYDARNSPAAVSY